MRGSGFNERPPSFSIAGGQVNTGIEVCQAVIELFQGPSIFGRVLFQVGNLFVTYQYLPATPGRVLFPAKGMQNSTVYPAHDGAVGDGVFSRCVLQGGEVAIEPRLCFSCRRDIGPL